MKYIYWKTADDHEYISGDKQSWFYVRYKNTNWEKRYMSQWSCNIADLIIPSWVILTYKLADSLEELFLEAL